MAYIQGTANDMFDLLEIIKNLAVSQGWEVLSDTTTPYNDIPRDGKFCSVEYGSGAISSNKTNSANSLRVLMPREISPESVSFIGGGSVTIYGILFDQTKELIASGVSSGYEFGDEVKAKKYIQIEANGTNAMQDFHLNFTSENESLSRYLVLSNNDDVNNVILNLEAFIDIHGKANLAITTSTGFSPDLNIGNQLHSKVGYLLGDDGEIDYYANLNNQRLIIFTRIYRPDDSMQKNEVWQLGYIGRIRLYGGEWALPDCNAIVASSFESKKWNETNKANITAPFVYFSGAFSQVNSTAFDSASVTAVNANIEAPQGGEIFSTPIICYNSNNIFGELDGLYSIILPDGLNRLDTITLENENFLVVQSGTGFNKFDTFAMSKE